MRYTILFLLCFFITSVTFAQQNDGIPDNCENIYGEHYRPNLFPRYEPQNSRLVLVDWESGNDMLELDVNLPDTIISGWSVDCRYLAVASGTNESRATRVYDTLTGGYIGNVPDARGTSHRIEWGPDGFLVVETRNGGILWNVPQNIQYQYDTGFNTTSYRNFSQLRWDVEQQLLIANLAVGGRFIIDLNTGNLTSIDSSVPGEIIAGGERFFCGTTYNDGFVTNARNVGGLYIGFARSGGVIYLGRGRGSRAEILETLDVSNRALDARSLGWSANCRYIAASVLVQSIDSGRIYETWIWEYATKRLVGIFEDARSIAHPLSWDTAERHVLVQTRFGSYLWDLETNERNLVYEPVESICRSSYAGRCYSPRPQSFYSVFWDAGRQQLLAVPVDQSNVIVAYDVNTGAEVERFNILPEATENPVHFITSNDSRLIAAKVNSQIYLINRETGNRTIFELPNNYVNIVISPDSRYFVARSSSSVYVWDINTLTSDSQPIFIWDNYRNYFSSGSYFINNTLLEYATNNQSIRLDITTGEITGLPPAPPSSEAQSPITYNTVDGVSGWATRQPHYYYGGRWNHVRDIGNWDCPVLPYHRGETRQFFLHDMQTEGLMLIADNLNAIQYMEMSPDCQTIYTEIQVLNTDLPYDETPATTSRSQYASRVDIVFWDIATGQATITLEPSQYRRGWSRVYWSPDSVRALVRHDTNFSLVNFREQYTIPLSSNFARNPQVYWDYERGQVYATNNSGVVALDVNTGEERFRFTAGEEGQRGCSFYSTCLMSFSDDLNWIFIYGRNEFAVWNINTLEHAYLPIESANGRGALISPDGRYLVISRSAVRVWDLWNLANDYEAREPIATYGVGNRAVISTRFIDNTTLEVITSSDTGTSTSHYDVATGGLVNSQ